ncbi:MAG: hypothetical protein R3F19_26340 [Verrucomicrobiales bacterium]
MEKQIRNLLNTPEKPGEKTLRKMLENLVNTDPRPTQLMLQLGLKKLISGSKSKSPFLLEIKKISSMHPWKFTKSAVKNHLKQARARNEKLEKEGMLRNPTKEWSKDSLKTLAKALSGEAETK